jgi:hypothetical protein
LLACVEKGAKLGKYARRLEKPCFSNNPWQIDAKR